MWSGSIDSIPEGWALCDGNNGTPDLTGTFVRHADGVTFNPGDQGGSATDSIVTSSEGDHTHTTDSQGAHTHSGTTGNHQLTTAQLPQHGHYMASEVSGTNNARINNYPNKPFRIYGRYRGDDDTEYELVADIGVADGGATSGLTSYVGSNESHSHTISSDGAHTHTLSTTGAHTHTATVDTIPPYYALAYIMRVAD